MTLRVFMAAIQGRFRDLRNRKRRLWDRERLDLSAFLELLPVLEEIRTCIADSALPLPDVHHIRWYEDDGHAHLSEFGAHLARLEAIVLGVRAPGHTQIRDMIENIILDPRYRNEYYVRAAAGHIEDRLRAAGLEVSDRSAG